MLRSRVAFSGLSTGPAVSTMFWGASSDSAGAAEVASALNTFWGTLVSQIAAGGTIFFDGELEVVNVATGQVESSLQQSTWTLTSTGTGEPLPIGTQGLLQWRTGVYAGGREVRGRTFMIDPTESMSTNGSPTSSYRDALEAAADVLVADGPAGLSVYSKKNGTLTRVSGVSCWPKWAFLRSRRD